MEAQEKTPALLATWHFGSIGNSIGTKQYHNNEFKTHKFLILNSLYILLNNLKTNTILLFLVFMNSIF